MPELPPIHRVFLGWESAPLVAAASHLTLRYRRDGELALGQVIVVLPGRRAGRRLLELLVDSASAQNLVLTPPDVITESELPQRLMEQFRPSASPLMRSLAWFEAIRRLDPALRKVLIPHPPPEQAHLGWLQIGTLLGRVYSDIAAGGHSIDSVLSAGGAIPGFADKARWEALRAASELYHGILDAAGLSDPDTARLQALADQQISCESDIVLVGMIDFNAVLARMLTQVAPRVTALIAAPTEEEARFDAFGRIRPESWAAFPVPIRDEQISCTEDPDGQAEATVRWLANLGGRFPVEQIVIGVPDPSVVPPLRRRLADAGIGLRWLDEKTVGESGPYRLLAAAVHHAATRSYESFADLVRHPDLARWLDEQGQPMDLAALDRFYADELPSRIGESHPAMDDGLQSAVRRIHAWLKPALGERPLSDWATTFSDILNAVYSGRGPLQLDREPDRTLYESLQRILSALTVLREIPTSLSPVVSASDAFAIAVEAVSRDALPPPPDADAIELLGWLELPLDTAAAVLVTTFNDGFVPTNAGADPFLPDALRVRLEIEHNARRCARDKYLTALLARSRHFGCIVARRDANKDPLLPSRLLFTGPDAEVIGRVNQWTRIPEQVPPANGPTNRPLPFAVPRPKSFPRRSTGFRVTEFRTYLACKYRYYLKHVCNLAAVEDSEREFNGAVFGSLIHQVLEDWGNDPHWRECGDAEELARHLIGRLTDRADVRFADSRPAIRLQIAQAGRRLRGLAHCQAILVADGWRIVYVEQERQKLIAPFPIGGDEHVELFGRIDRIDYNAATNTVRILDYKTGDKARTPEEQHRRRDDWIDLQLPLYRHLWRQAPGLDVVPHDAHVELGYFQIPRECEGVHVAIADNWDRTALEHADETARTVIAGILAGVFWPPTSPAPENFEEYAAICLDGLNAPSIAEEVEDDA